MPDEDPQAEPLALDPEFDAQVEPETVPASEVIDQDAPHGITTELIDEGDER